MMMEVIMMMMMMMMIQMVEVVAYSCIYVMLDKQVSMAPIGDITTKSTRTAVVTATTTTRMLIDTRPSDGTIIKMLNIASIYARLLPEMVIQNECGIYLVDRWGRR
jgi:hypothetical protein